MEPIVAVFRGGVSPEREVSLGSGAAALAALKASFDRVEDFEISGRALPRGVFAGTHVVFSTLHGIFGEDGGMQSLLECEGIAFAGCDAASSAHCFDKARCKETVAAHGVPVASGIVVTVGEANRAAELLACYGPRVVSKPNSQGSSVGLRFSKTVDELREAISDAPKDGLLVESCVAGREITVGVLDGEAMGIVEIRPKSGTFDYESKYTKGRTEYIHPAPIGEEATAVIQKYAEIAFRACGCRDFARIDFMIGDEGPRFLEINTLPGLKETSLLPMSASCIGLNFNALVERMTVPALRRQKLSLSGAAASGSHQ